MNIQYSTLDSSNALLALSVAGALAYSLTARSQPSVPRMFAKTASIGSLAVLNAILGSPRLLIAAQAFGSIGDAFLAWDGEGPFLYGLASFLTAHIFYIILFTQTGVGSTLLLSETWRIGTAVLVLLASLGLTIKLIPRVASRLRVPILVYSVAIYAMVLAALTIDNTRLVCGAIMFTASDSLLATEKFLLPAASSHRLWMEYTVWALYYFGQVLIMIGFLEYI